MSVKRAHSAMVRFLCCDLKGKSFATASSRIVIVWDVLKREKIIHTKIEERLKGICFGHNDDVLMIATENKLIAWNFVKNTKSKINHDKDIREVTFSPNCKYLAIGEHRDIHILETLTGRLSQSLHSKRKEMSLDSIAFSPDGSFLATSGFGHRVETAGYVEIWNIQSGELEATFIDPGKENWFMHIRFSPIEKWIAIGCNISGIVKIWDFLNQRLVFSQKGHSSYVGQIEFSSKGDRLATCSGDGTICIWNTDKESSSCWQSLKTLNSKLNCRGMLIEGAHGLEQEIKWNVGGQARKGTLLEFFADRGAVLDEKQKQILANETKSIYEQISNSKA